MNKDLHLSTAWGSREIRARSEALAMRVCAIWPGPISSHPQATGFATPTYWRPLETLLARLPRGWWASREDIAAAVGHLTYVGTAASAQRTRTRGRAPRHLGSGQCRRSSKRGGDPPPRGGLASCRWDDGCVPPTFAPRSASPDRRAVLKGDPSVSRRSQFGIRTRIARLCRRDRPAASMPWLWGGDMTTRYPNSKGSRELNSP